MSVEERVNSISDNTNLTIDTPFTTAKIEVCGKCNLDCEFCWHKNLKNRFKLMGLDNYEYILQQLENTQVKEVGLFFMGESGLHPKLDIMYSKLKPKYFTYLTTNAVYIPNIIKALPYIDSLKVSFNYKDSEDFMKKTNRDLSVFQVIKDNIKTLHEECNKLGKKLTVSTVLDSDKNLYEESLKSISWDSHYFIPLQSQGGTGVGLQGVVGTNEIRRKPIPCWSLFKGLYIDVNLNVRTCCYGHKNCHILGSLKNQPLEEIINSETLNNMKRAHLRNNIPNPCRECLKDYM